MKYNTVFKLLLITISLVIINSCKTTDDSRQMDMVGKVPKNLFAEIEVSSDQFAGMTGSGTIAIEGIDKMGLSINAIFGLQVMDMYLDGDNAKVAVHIQQKAATSENVFQTLSENAKMDIYPELITSIFKGTIPNTVKFTEKPEQKGEKLLYRRKFDSGVEYYLIDNQKRLVQYQQKTTEEGQNGTVLYSDHRVINGYTIPHKIQIKNKEQDISITINYSNVSTDIPEGYEFDFTIPPSYEKYEMKR